jgi:hypothetical protein
MPHSAALGKPYGLRNKHVSFSAKDTDGWVLTSFFSMTLPASFHPSRTPLFALSSPFPLTSFFFSLAPSPLERRTSEEMTQKKAV